MHWLVFLMTSSTKDAIIYDLRKLSHATNKVKMSADMACDNHAESNDCGGILGQIRMLLNRFSAWRLKEPWITAPIRITAAQSSKLPVLFSFLCMQYDFQIFRSYLDVSWMETNPVFWGARTRSIVLKAKLLPILSCCLHCRFVHDREPLVDLASINGSLWLMPVLLCPGM